MSAEKELKEIGETLKRLESRIDKLESKINAKDKEKYSRQPPSKNSIEKLAEKTKISLEEIKNIFDIEDRFLTLLTIQGDEVKDKTKNVALLILLGYKYIFNNEDVLSKEIKRNLEENKIRVDNFGTYLNEIIPSLIRRKGKSKSPKTTYRLTTLGEAEAKELLRKLSGERNE